MNKWPAIRIIITGILVGSLTAYLPAAAEENSLDTTVKIGVCGDGIKEGDEECDINDFGSTTCSSFGKEGDNLLVCTVDCQIDHSACIIPPPAPSPPLTFIELPSIPDLFAPVIARDPPPVDDQEEQSPASRFICNLPAVIQVFDITGSCRLRLENLYETVKTWVDDWQEKLFHAPEPATCDINQDGQCDLQDLSILLFHIER